MPGFKNLKNFVIWRKVKSAFPGIAVFAFLAVGFQNCGQTNRLNGINLSNGNTSTASAPVIAASGTNVLPIVVGNCGVQGFTNEACVTVTICSPGTFQCQSIPNILLATASTGLRLFSSLITLPLTQVTTSSGANVAECGVFGDGQNAWGPVQMADVILGTEKASAVPIQVINSQYATPPTSCTIGATLLASPANSGFNGILGVGMLRQDCGSECVTALNNQVYFACQGAICTASALALTDQVTNPITLLPLDNNGIVIALPAVAEPGVSSVTGSLILGIGTESNNIPGDSVRGLQANSYGSFSFNFGGMTYPGFFDLGSNAVFVSANIYSGLSADTCAGIPGYFCPATLVTAGGSIQSTITNATLPITLEIDNATLLFSNSNNAVLPDLAGSFTDNIDLGLPFFFGKTIYLGVTGASSSLGAGPLVGY